MTKSQEHSPLQASETPECPLCGDAPAKDSNYCKRHTSKKKTNWDYVPSTLIALMAYISLTLIAPIARAECVTLEKATLKDTCVVMPRGDVRGVWFELTEADGMRRLKLEIPQLRFQIEKLEAQVAIEKRRAEMFKEAADLRAQALEASEKLVDRTLETSAKVQDNANAWYRSPVLWFAVGVVVTSAAVIGIAKAGE